MTTNTILRIDTSARRANSVSRTLTDAIVARFPEASVTTRDLAAAPLPHINEGFVTVTKGSAQDTLSDTQRDMIALSDALIEELRAADTIVIGLPVYNFAVPSGLKAWIDLVARAGETFRYSEAGPEGLLKGKRAIIAMASGGTEAGSEIDFATPYLRHVLGFIGITDIELVKADRLAFDPEGTMKAAQEQVATLAA
ncbi:FMN-dependent NADH-azoreductase [Tropicimonas isoalkanivorans]|uniref:FMN dependent NADH:quinone oxidoreductase n=1 Tax=Tropicimonas isoalkanivorans TaxID=441112 RepID=A0A1I1JRP2_9RHOB|nr:NAD(P)H-dependent oxidoreductase [Tropicimonas isoalkanivorans]SFC50622.1 FMN-dependent NADH-azoreductase [Tropicimonas isoalkanivorans]